MAQDTAHLQPLIGWNQNPMTKSHIAQLTQEEIVMSIDVPIDVPLTMEFGRLTPIRPADDSSGIYPPNSKEGARVNVSNATVAALKAGLALHFRRQLKELTRDHRRACDEIPTIPHSVLAVRVGDTFTQDDGAADGGDSDWKVHYTNDEHKKKYYSHKVTGETRWDLPTPVVDTPDKEDEEDEEEEEEEIYETKDTYGEDTNRMLPACCCCPCLTLIINLTPP